MKQFTKSIKDYFSSGRSLKEPGEIEMEKTSSLKSEDNSSLSLFNFSSLSPINVSSLSSTQVPFTFEAENKISITKQKCTQAYRTKSWCKFMPDDSKVKGKKNYYKLAYCDVCEDGEWSLVKLRLLNEQKLCKHEASVKHMDYIEKGAYT